MSLDDRAKLLETVTQIPLGVRELIRKLRWNPSRVTQRMRNITLPNAPIYLSLPRKNVR